MKFNVAINRLTDDLVPSDLSNLNGDWVKSNEVDYIAISVVDNYGVETEIATSSQHHIIKCINPDVLSVVPIESSGHSGYKVTIGGN